jgi:glutamate-1-semialdehyde 2,1-aminomutase
VRWCAYGAFSEFQIYTADATPEAIHAGKVPWQLLKQGASAELQHKIRLGFLLNGVDITGWPGGVTSAAHTPADVQKTLDAFDATLDLLSAEGEL